MAYTKVVIVGGGFGGLNAAKALGNGPFDVWLIDKTNHHLFQPLLYEVATAALSPADIATPIREVVKNYENITVIMGEITSIDKKKKKLYFKDNDTIDFDVLILAPGARHSYFGKEEWEEHAPGIKSLVDALKIRERILISFERAERCDVISEAKKYLNFVIIGAGPTGVELAGAIAEIAYQTMLKDFRRINPKQSNIYLVEGSGQVLPAFPKNLGKKAKKYLEKFGVKILLNQKVTEVTNKGVKVDKTFIESTNVIWAAGNQASCLLKTLDTELDRAGRAVVGKDLSLPGFPHIFVIGDAAHVKDQNDRPLPALAPSAIQQGRYVAKILRYQYLPEKRPPFKYFDKGSLATIGKKKAVGLFRKIQFSGFIAWLAWAFIHIMYLIDFRNRVIVFTQWMFSYFSGQKGARLINRSLEEELIKSKKNK
jgi:NADH:ubiquinone reductase (H+-translocating)